MQNIPNTHIQFWSLHVQNLLQSSMVKTLSNMQVGLLEWHPLCGSILLGRDKGFLGDARSQKVAQCYNSSCFCFQGYKSRFLIQGENLQFTFQLSTGKLLTRSMAMGTNRMVGAVMFSSQV